MKTVHYLIISGAIILLSAFTISKSVNWKIANNHSIKFSGTEVDGIFKDLNGSVQFDEMSLETSKVSFAIAVKSINTGNGTKNKHAVSDKWFDATKYPTIKFEAAKFVKTTKGYSATGNMSIHGVTKEMTIPFSFDNGLFKSKFSVNRMDFKIGTMKGMSKKVSNAIELDVTIPVTK
jgi:polyisoprenoid-binding protein YceI